MPEKVLAEDQWIAVPDMNALVFNGSVNQNTAEQFRAALSQYPGTTIVAFNSPGGYVVPALEVAAEIYVRDIDTVILEGSVCYSACSFMFMAGDARNAVGQLGVHQVSGIDDISITQNIVAKIYDNLLTFGAEKAFLNAMFRTASDDMYIFSAAEIENLNVNRTSKDSSALHLEPSETLAGFDTIASTKNGSWEAVLLRNQNNGHYLCALESAEQRPLFRLVQYLTKRDSFVEILNIPYPMAPGNEPLHLTFLSLNKEPTGFSVGATIEDQQTAWFNINNEEQGAFVIVPIALYRHMKLESNDGRLLGLYDLTGSLKSSQAFSRCILNTF